MTDQTAIWLSENEIKRLAKSRFSITADEYQQLCSMAEAQRSGAGDVKSVDFETLGTIRTEIRKVSDKVMDGSLLERDLTDLARFCFKLGQSIPSPSHTGAVRNSKQLEQDLRNAASLLDGVGAHEAAIVVRDATAMLATSPAGEQGEPVAWMRADEAVINARSKRTYVAEDPDYAAQFNQPLYATPQPQQGGKEKP